MRRHAYLLAFFTACGLVGCGTAIWFVNQDRDLNIYAHRPARR